MWHGGLARHKPPEHRILKQRRDLGQGKGRTVLRSGGSQGQQRVPEHVRRPTSERSSAAWIVRRMSLVSWRMDWIFSRNFSFGQSSSLARSRR